MKTIIDAVNTYKAKFPLHDDLLQNDECLIISDKTGVLSSGATGFCSNHFIEICNEDDFNQCVKEMMTNFNTSPTYSEYSGMLKVATELSEKHKQSVFTKEMQDNGLPPLVGMKLNIEFLSGASYNKSTLTYLGDNVGCFKCKDGKEYTFAMNSINFRAIDNRTDKEKAMDDMWDSYRTCDKSALRPQIVVKLIEAIKSGKVHGVKWVGEQ